MLAMRERYSFTYALRRNELASPVTLNLFFFIPRTDSITMDDAQESNNNNPNEDIAGTTDTNS